MIKFNSCSHETQSLTILILCVKCAETHLRASVVEKKILGSLTLAMKGKKNGKGRGGEGKERKGKGLDRRQIRPPIDSISGSAPCIHTDVFCSFATLCSA